MSRPRRLFSTAPVTGPSRCALPSPISKVDRTESTELFLWRVKGGADVYRCYPDTVDPRGPKGK
jgi:hypothetical protein